MTNRKFMGAGSPLALTAALTMAFGPTISQAQTSAASRAAISAPTAASTTSTVLPTLGGLADEFGLDHPGQTDFVVLEGFTPKGEVPRSARPDTIALDSPYIGREKFMRRYPEAGAAIYELIRRANKSNCDLGVEYLQELVAIDTELDQHLANFMKDKDIYLNLQEIYSMLPDEVKRTTNIMTVAQAAATGALCLLTSGLYCIAAIATFIGGFFSNRQYKKLTLISIKLALANVVATLHNLDFQMTSVRFNKLAAKMYGHWVFLAMSACVKQFQSAFPASGSFTQPAWARSNW